MEKSNLSRWAELLLDLGKGNNLVNFKDVKLKTVEILLPEMETLFEKADHGTCSAVSFGFVHIYNVGIVAADRGGLSYFKVFFAA